MDGQHLRARLILAPSSTGTSTSGGATGDTGNGIHAAGSTLNLSGATIATNGASGLYLNGSGGTISGDTFNANTAYAIDTTGGSPAVSGVAGSWKGVALGAATDYGGLLPVLSYLIIEKAGQAQTMGGTVGATSANLMMFATTVQLNNATISQSSNIDIYSNGSTPNVRNTIVAYNSGAGLSASGGAPSFTYGDVFGNGANVVWAAGASSKTRPARGRRPRASARTR